MAPELGQNPGVHPEHTAYANFVRAIEESRINPGDGRLKSMVKDSSLNIFDQGYKEAFTNKSSSPQAKAAYVAGRLVHDVVNDGSRIPWWFLNHPMAQISLAAEMAGDAAGLEPDYNTYKDQLDKANIPVTKKNISNAWAKDMGFYHEGNRKGIPASLAAKAPAIVGAASILANSNNADFLNIAGGGRPPGFASVFPSEGDRTVSDNPLLELGARYLFGRSGRLLPFEQFTEERPEVSPTDYHSYRRHQWDRGVVLGLFKGTNRNIDAEPEFSMQGFRVPLSGAASVAGGLGGVVAGSKIADHLLARQAASEAGKGVNAANVSKIGRGNARLAGAALGGILSSLGTRELTRAANRHILQPAINPQAVADAEAWEDRQRERGRL
jgi:hypothetical protein